MRTNILMLSVFLASAVWISCDDDDDDNSKDLNQNDMTFVQSASLSNSMEIDFAQLALSKGTDTVVQSFAQLMIDEHTVAQNDLQNLVANYNNVDLTGNMDEEHQQLRQQLMSLTGNSFDSLYMNSQVNDHQETLTLFQNAQTNTRHISGFTFQSLIVFAML
jgi:putative membrane protein